MIQLNERQEEITALKKAKNAIVLAHYYQPLEIQDIADHVCDSFAMAKKASEADENIIIICGVVFMAESAKILSPNKKVLHPSPDAGCPMADMVTPEDVLELKRQHPDGVVICYVNSSAAVKAVSDICCTSSSAVKIARTLDTRKIIFVPDRNLGTYTAKLVPEKEFILWRGFCPAHMKVTEQDVLRAKSECRAEVLDHADYIGSTAGIIEFTKGTDAMEIIIGTEIGIIERLRRELPNKRLYSVSNSFICPNMKKTSLQDVLTSLEKEIYEVDLTSEEIESARQSLERMIAS
jgi:quinolinate synthase